MRKKRNQEVKVQQNWSSDPIVKVGHLLLTVFRSKVPVEGNGCSDISYVVFVNQHCESQLTWIVSIDRYRSLTDSYRSIRQSVFDMVVIRCFGIFVQFYFDSITNRISSLGKGTKTGLDLASHRLFQRCSLSGWHVSDSNTNQIFREWALGGKKDQSSRLFFILLSFLDQFDSNSEKIHSFHSLCFRLSLTSTVGFLLLSLRFSSYLSSTSSSEIAFTHRFLPPLRSMGSNIFCQCSPCANLSPVTLCYPFRSCLWMHLLSLFQLWTTTWCRQWMGLQTRKSTTYECLFVFFLLLFQNRFNDW